MDKIADCSNDIQYTFEVLDSYICCPLLSPNDDVAPYNGEVAYSINTDRTTSLGFAFSHLNDWIYHLIDQIIEELT